jgi:hypothetical protein
VPIDTTTPRSAGWWLEKLGQRLHERTTGRRWSTTARFRRDIRPGLDLLHDYLIGDPPLPHVAQGWRDALLPFIRESRMNYAELVTESARERMIPLGWTTAVDADESGDEVATRIAAANQLQLRSADVFRWMLALGHGYMLIGPPRANGIPVISEEDPREVITADDPATGEAIAALKLFRDEWTGDQLAYVYVPGAVWVARRPASSLAAAGYFGEAWEWDRDLSGAYPAGFEDLVPVVCCRNRDGRGEYELHMDVLDRINSEIFRRVALALYQAHRQRAVIGLPTTIDGKPLKADKSNLADYSEVFTADPGAMWQLDADVKFWESTPVDLGSIRLAVKDDVQALAAVTRTPLHYITPDAAAGSAEGASVQREGLVYRVEDRRRRADGALARAMSIAFRMMGETQRADVVSIRTLWQPAERFSLQERASAASQARAGGLPTRRIRRDIWQYPPEDMAALDREEADDLRREAERQVLLGDANAGQAVPQPQRQPQPQPVPAAGAPAA